MIDKSNLDDLTERGLIGAIESNASGVAVDATGDDLEIFGSILGYIAQVGDMIGEPFGMDSLEEIRLVGSNTVAVCVPQEESTLGLLCSSRANIDEIVGEMVG